jgi:hypothetical protein
MSLKGISSNIANVFDNQNSVNKNEAKTSQPQIAFPAKSNQADCLTLEDKYNSKIGIANNRSILAFNQPTNQNTPELQATQATTKIASQSNNEMIGIPIPSGVKNYKAFSEQYGVKVGVDSFLNVFYVPNTKEGGRKAASIMGDIINKGLNGNEQVLTVSKEFAQGWREVSGANLFGAVLNVGTSFIGIKRGSTGSTKSPLPNTELVQRTSQKNAPTVRQKSNTSNTSTILPTQNANTKPNFPSAITESKKTTPTAGEIKAQKAAVEAQKTQELEKRLNNLRSQLQDKSFLNSNGVKKSFGSRPSSGSTVGNLKAEISVELTRKKLLEMYPQSQGYKVIKDVKIYKDTGYASKEEYRQKTGNEPKGMIEKNNKLLREVPDSDIMVVKKGSNGKLDIIRLEQVKSGKERPADAKKQIEDVKKALNETGDTKLFIEGKDVTRSFNVDTALKADMKTRGPIRNTKPNDAKFDGDYGATTNDLNTLAKEMEKKSKQVNK